jgi:hypothetical protein
MLTTAKEWMPNDIRPKLSHDLSSSPLLNVKKYEIAATKAEAKEVARSKLPTTPNANSSPTYNTSFMV